MAGVHFTPQQQDAIDVRGGNILVSAAAGSGKTAVLTQRVIELMTGEQPIEADRMVIVTFTVASAVEMKQRIEQKLSELLEQDPENQLYQSQQMLLSRAHISTIHALCSELIRDHFEELELPAGFRVAEENELAVIQSDLLDEVVEEQYASGKEEFLFLASNLSGRDDRKLFELVQKLYQFIRCYPYPLEQLDRFLFRYQDHRPFTQTDWGNQLLSHTVQLLGEAEKLLTLALEQMAGEEQVQKQYAPAFQQDLDQVRLTVQVLEQGDWDRAVGIARHWEKKRLSAVRGYDGKEFLEQLKTLRSQADDLISRVRSQCLITTEEEYQQDLADLEQVCTPLFALVKEFYYRMEQEKHQRAILDFADLEHMALKLLVERFPGGYRKTEAAMELSQRYAEIMVDECQDINLVQNLIFWAISQGSREISEDMDQVLTDSRNLFLVGDVKQSIYRFRNAVPQLFVRRSQLFCDYSRETHSHNSCGKILLQNNFRSRSQVTDLVNSLFCRIMTPQLGEIPYGQEEALVASAEYPSAPQAMAELHLLDSAASSDEDSMDQTDREAAYVANLIQKMVLEGYPVTEHGELRPCRYRDFCILLRSKKGKTERYVEKLKECRINCYADLSSGYFDSFEIAVMLDLLRVIDNPLLDIPLFSVLISPMFGFTADEAAAIRLKKKRTPLYFNLQALAEEGDQKCGDFLETLKLLRTQALLLPTGRLIQKIYDQTGFVFVVESMVSGEQKRANLRLLLSYAESYEKIGYRGLSGFIRFVDRAIERGEDFSCANTVSEKADVVKIMSVHGSKGLEFPICIVADLGKPFNLMDLNQTYLMNGEQGFGIKIRKPEQRKEYTNLPLEAIKLVSRREILSEEMRTLYVAMTRAKEKLILVGSHREPERYVERIAKDPSRGTPISLIRQRSFLDWIVSAFCGSQSFRQSFPQLSGEEQIPLRCVFSGKTEGTQETVQEILFFSQPDPEMLQTLERSLNYQYPYEELSQLPAKVTVTKLAKERNQEQQGQLEPLQLREQGELTGAQRGTILHSFMQYADLDAAVQDLEQEIQRLVQRGFLTDREAEALNRYRIRTFLRSNLFVRMKRAKQVYREYQFIYEIPAKEVNAELSECFAGEKVLMQGIADAVLEEADGMVIVDYKTDYLKEPQLFLERYQDQLRIYREALSSYFDLPIKECCIYSLYLGQEIRVV